MADGRGQEPYPRFHRGSRSEPTVARSATNPLAPTIQKNARSREGAGIVFNLVIWPLSVQLDRLYRHDEFLVFDTQQDRLGGLTIDIDLGVVGNA